MATHPDPDSRFDDIIEDLTMLGATGGRMFGARAVKADGKVVACLLRDKSMVFKLGEDTREHAAALALSGAVLWDPSGRDRPFRDWVRVPYDHGDEWGHLAEEALRRLRQKL